MAHARPRYGRHSGSAAHGRQPPHAAAARSPLVAAAHAGTCRFSALSPTPALHSLLQRLTRDDVRSIDKQGETLHSPVADASRVGRGQLRASHNSCLIALTVCIPAHFTRSMLVINSDDLTDFLVPLVHAVRDAASQRATISSSAADKVAISASAATAAAACSAAAAASALPVAPVPPPHDGIKLDATTRSRLFQLLGRYSQVRAKASIASQRLLFHPWYG